MYSLHQAWSYDGSFIDLSPFRMTEMHGVFAAVGALVSIITVASEIKNKF
jgi:hypothetical protein